MDDGEIHKICVKCFVLHTKNGRFCSRRCANSRVHSEETKRKISASVKTSTKFAESIKNKRPIVSAPHNKECPICNITFYSPTSDKRIFCTKACYLQDKKRIFCKPCGGYRERSGRSKTGYYKGIYCGSTYELCWTIYNLDHNIVFSRFCGYLQGDGIKYYPDFILSDNKTIVEIKGYERADAVLKKTNLAESLGYNVKVLYKKDLQHCFEYVTVKYGTSEYQTLYDDYKPKYEYECQFCKNKFFREIKKKNALTYCSCRCSAKHRHIKRKYYPGAAKLEGCDRL